VRYTSLQPPAEATSAKPEGAAHSKAGQPQLGSMLPAPQSTSGVPIVARILQTVANISVLLDAAGFVRTQHLATPQVLSTLHSFHRRLRLLQLVLHGLSRQQQLLAQRGQRLMTVTPARQRSPRLIRSACGTFLHCTGAELVCHLTSCVCRSQVRAANAKLAAEIRAGGAVAPAQSPLPPRPRPQAAAASASGSQSSPSAPQAAPARKPAPNQPPVPSRAAVQAAQQKFAGVMAKPALQAANSPAPASSAKAAAPKAAMPPVPTRAAVQAAQQSMASVLGAKGPGSTAATASSAAAAGERVYWPGTYGLELHHRLCCARLGVG